MKQATDDKTRCHGHILLAEDDPVMQMVTKKVLEQAADTGDMIPATLCASNLIGVVIGENKCTLPIVHYETAKPTSAQVP